MAQELDYIKVKVGVDKTNAYSNTLKDLQFKLETGASLTKENITKSIADSVDKMTQNLKLSTEDKQELNEKVSSHTANTINPFLGKDQKIDKKQFTNELNQKMEQSVPNQALKNSISKTDKAAARQIGDAMKAALKLPGRIVAAVANKFQGKKGKGHSK